MYARLTGLVLLVLPALAGCDAVRAIGYSLAPEQKTSAEFTLTKQRLAIVVDVATGQPDYPLFRQALHDRLAALLREHKLTDDIPPYAAQLDLQARFPDYPHWSVQRIGRELHAAQVLYIRVTGLTLRETPEYPVLEPKARVRLLVLDPQASSEKARLWPADQDGKELEATCTAEEASDKSREDQLVQRLGRAVAEHAVRLFYEHPTDDKPPTEP